MLDKLLSDVQTLASLIPDLQGEAEAVQADLADPTSVNLPQLLADVTDLQKATAAVAGAVVAVTADLQSLPQAAITKINWQNLVCTAIPIYNSFAAVAGWPTIPLPAFCTPATK